MHELGIMESAMALVSQHALAAGAQRVTRVVVRVGGLAGVEPEALRFAFAEVARGTLADGAEFEIEAVPVVVDGHGCQCGFTVDTGGYIFVCPDCGDLCGEIRSGRELELGRIEMN